MNSHNADENFVKFDWQKLCGRIRLPNCFGQSPDSPTRVHQVWPGNNVFFFNGRVICGPDPRGFLLTITSILLSEWIFCTYIDDFPPQNSIIITLSEFFTLAAIGSLVLACTRDPGIIPRNANLPLIEEVGSSSSTSTSMRRTRSRRITVDGIEIKLKYCSICKIFRPPRSCHCSVCDNCVEKFDHHCPWIGQCIGLRNYRYYMIFLLSALTFFGYMFGFSCWRMRKRVSGRHGGVFQSLMNIPETICLLVFSCFAVCFIGGLAMYHLYLIVLNQTGNENFKRQYAKSSNPYDKGALSNIKEALFSNLPPSKVNFRSVVEPRSDSNWADGGGAVQDEEAFISKAESP